MFFPVFPSFSYKTLSFLGFSPFVFSGFTYLLIIRISQNTTIVNTVKKKYPHFLWFFVKPLVKYKKLCYNVKKENFP